MSRLSVRLLKISNCLLAYENDFQKRDRLIKIITEHKERLEQMLKKHNNHYSLMEQLLYFLKSTDQKLPSDQKNIKRLQQKKYHLVTLDGSDRNPQLFQKISNIFLPYMVKYPKEQQSLRNKINEYQMQLKDIQHKLGNKGDLFNCEFPEEFEKAMDEIKQICIYKTQLDIEYQIGILEEKLQKQNLWNQFIKQYRRENINIYNKLTAFVNINQFKKRQQDTQFVKKIEGEYRYSIQFYEEPLQHQLNYQLNRDAQKEGTRWYNEQRHKMLCELSIYCDDIIQAKDLIMARDGKFNIKVLSSNGVFRVLTSPVQGHYRQGYWVRPHWRLTVSRIKQF